MRVCVFSALVVSTADKPPAAAADHHHHHRHSKVGMVTTMGYIMPTLVTVDIINYKHTST